jgi:hypothetical protein
LAIRLHMFHHFCLRSCSRIPTDCPRRRQPLVTEYRVRVSRWQASDTAAGGRAIRATSGAACPTAVSPGGPTPPLQRRYRVLSNRSGIRVVRRARHCRRYADCQFSDRQFSDCQSVQSRALVGSGLGRPAYRDF